MKMPKEYTLVIIGGLFLLSYILEAIVDPLSLALATPYEYLNPDYLSLYPFTTATVFIRSIALLMTPMWLLSFINKAHYAKGGVLLIVASLMQLYAIQEVATGTTLVPLEWSLSLSIAGAVLLIPSVLFIIRGMLASAQDKISGKPTAESQNSLEN